MSAEFDGEVAGVSSFGHGRVRSSGSVSAGSAISFSSSSPPRSSSSTLKPWQKPSFKAASSVREKDNSNPISTDLVDNQSSSDEEGDELTPEELEMIETPLSDLLPYETGGPFPSQKDEQLEDRVLDYDNSTSSYLVDENDKMPLGRKPSFGSEQVPHSLSSDRGVTSPGKQQQSADYDEIANHQNSTVHLSGAVRSATDITAPPSDDSSASTNPYHSDEGSENDSLGPEPQVPIVVEEICEESPASSREREVIKSTPSEAANEIQSVEREASRQPPALPPARCSSFRQNEGEQEGDSDESESYIPKALLGVSMSETKRVTPKKQQQQQQQPIPEQRPETHGPSTDRDIDAPPPVQRRTLPQGSMSPQANTQQKKKKGLFGRSASAGRPTTARQSSSAGRAASTGRPKHQAKGSPAVPTSAAAPLPDKQASRRSWFSGRRKKQQSQSQSAILVSPDRSASSARAGTSDIGSVSSVSLQRQNSTAKLIQSLTNVPEAEVTLETAEQAVIELEALQSELEKLRSNADNTETANVAQLRKELEAAQKAASQLELLNKNYRKAQKQMLQDLQESQTELEKFQRSRVAGPGDTQRLAQELASTTSELRALQEEHKTLARRTSQRALKDSDGLDTISDADRETKLNLQKDLAQAMATISKFEDENTMILRRLQRLEGVEQRLEQVQAERDHFMSQLNTKDQASFNGAPADAVAMISRLQTEKRQLVSREMVLKEKISRLETKNENQKTIFQTAVEIKETEMKITKKERDILAARLEEYKREKKPQHESSNAEAMEVLRSRLKELEEQCRENEIFINDLNEKSEELKQDVDAKRTAIESLQKQLRESNEEAQAKVEQSTTHLVRTISQLEQQIEAQEKQISDMKERRQLESFKTRRIMDEKVNQLQKQIDSFTSDLADRDEQIKGLEEEVKVRNSELQEEKKKALRRQSPRPNGDGSDGGEAHSDRLTALRSRLGNYENVMREKVASIRSMDAAAPAKDAQSEPAIVVATPVSAENPASDEKYAEMEHSLRKHETKIKELEKELEQARSDSIQSQKDENKPPEESKEVEELVQSLRESDDRITVLHKQLAETKLRLAESENSPTSEMAKVDESRVESEMGALLSQLAEKEETCLTLQKQVDALEEQKVDFIKKQEASANELQEAQARHGTMEAKLLRVSGQNQDEPASDYAENPRVVVLESELASISARLAEADSKIEMLEEFIQDDTQTMMNNTSVASSTVEGTFENAATDKESLHEKSREIEELTAAAQLARVQMERARSNADELESEKTQMQAKLAQLSSLLEKRGKDEADMQLYKKCIEVAEVSAEKEELSQKLRMANAVIKRLEEEVDSSEAQPDPEERSTTSKKSATSTAQITAKLAENELILDDMREKLGAAEKEARLLREQNEKASNESKGGLGSDEEFMHKMKFLEEQNAAYAASLKALRIEIATRHVGTAFE